MVWEKKSQEWKIKKEVETGNEQFRKQAPNKQKTKTVREPRPSVSMRI